MEINLVSDFDGPFNYTLGAYTIKNRNDNVYIVQTAGSQFMTSFGRHPYSNVVRGLSGNDWSGKAGLAFYQDMLDLVSVSFLMLLACQGGAPTCNPAGLVDLWNSNSYTGCISRFCNTIRVGRYY